MDMFNKHKIFIQETAVWVCKQKSMWALNLNNGPLNLTKDFSCLNLTTLQAHDESLRHKSLIRCNGQDS